MEKLKLFFNLIIIICALGIFIIGVYLIINPSESVEQDSFEQGHWECTQRAINISDFCLEYGNCVGMICECVKKTEPHCIKEVWVKDSTLKPQSDEVGK